MPTASGSGSTNAEIGPEVEDEAGVEVDVGAEVGVEVEVALMTVFVAEIR